MAILNIQAPSPAGAELSFVAAAGAGDSFSNNGRNAVIFKNPGSDVTVTFDAPGVDNFGFSGNPLDNVVVVPGGATHFTVGPFLQGRYNDANNRVQMTYSATGLSVAVITL